MRFRGPRRRFSGSVDAAYPRPISRLPSTSVVSCDDSQDHTQYGHPTCVAEAFATCDKAPRGYGISLALLSDGLEYSSLYYYTAHPDPECMDEYIAQAMATSGQDAR